MIGFIRYLTVTVLGVKSCASAPLLDSTGGSVMLLLWGFGSKGASCPPAGKIDGKRETS